MTKINSATQQANFINSFCSKNLSATELRIFNIEEGRVRIRDRIANFFSFSRGPTPASEGLELAEKHKSIVKLGKEFGQSNNEVFKTNLMNLEKIINPNKKSNNIPPIPLSGVVYGGY